MQTLRYVLLALTLPALSSRSSSQDVPSAAPMPPRYQLRVNVDEVSLSFHVTDRNGFAVRGLTLKDLTLLDDGQPPRKVLAFEPPRSRPVRVGVLIDQSESTQSRRGEDRALATQAVKRLIREPTDQAFIARFGRLSQVTQSWTSDPSALAAAVLDRSLIDATRSRGTALYDSLFQACQYQFGRIDHAGSDNLILLITDGEDNASHASLRDVVDACQRSNTAIDSFRPAGDSGLSSSGPAVLAELASQTGGRVFTGGSSPAELDGDLRLIDAELRSQYRLVYSPSQIKHDGSFHRIQMRAADETDTIGVQAGYYAPRR